MPPPTPKRTPKRRAASPRRSDPSGQAQGPDDVAQADLREEAKAQYLPEIHRLLPQAADAERGVLSSFLLAPREVGEKCHQAMVTKEHFHQPAHALIFETLMEMWGGNKHTDIITVTQILRDRKQLDQAGGPALVTELFTFLPTATNAEYYIGIIEEKHVLRQIISVGTEFASRSYEDQDDVPNILSEFESAAMRITQSRLDGRLRHKPISQSVMEAIHSIEQTIDRKGKIGGISTGFTALDRITDGLHKSEVFVIAARPSMGKTALAMNIAEHIAIDSRIPTAVFSLEMATKQLVQRAITGRAHVDWAMARQGFLNERDYPAMAKAATEIGQAPLYIEDNSDISPAYMHAILRRWVREYGIEVAIIDYLQLLRGTKQYKGDNREREVADISKGLKHIAKDLNLALIVLAQISRASETNADKMPRLSNLRESGSIEQDADTVGLLHRAEYYLTDPDEIAAEQGKATLQIAKQRNGPVGPVPLTFLKEFTRFENRATDQVD